MLYLSSTVVAPSVWNISTSYNSMAELISTFQRCFLAVDIKQQLKLWQSKAASSLSMEWTRTFPMGSSRLIKLHICSNINLVSEKNYLEVYFRVLKQYAYI